jgi:two-component system heavy metal sensor histidine kinase CusS
MTARLPIRWRLTVWYGAVLAAVLAIFAAAVDLLMARLLQQRTDHNLEHQVEVIEEQIELMRDAGSLRERLSSLFYRHPAFEMQVSEDGDGAWLRSAGVVDDGLPRPWRPPETPGEEVFEDVVVPGLGPSRMCSKWIETPHASLLVQAAMSTRLNDGHLRELRRALAFTVPVLLVAALACGYLLARKALAPVERLAAEADQITASRLDRRLATPNPDDELGRLARTLNGMIARLEHSFDKIQRFTADAAHELRTPLASLRSEAEVTLLADRDPAEYRRALVSMLEEIEHLTQLTEDLLTLCREDAQVKPSFADARLDEVVLEAVAAMAPVADKLGLRLVAEDLAPCVVRGDHDQLHRVAVNLIDNAVKYTPAGGRVEVSLAFQDGEARLTVADDGIGIPPEHLPMLFKRFYRVDASRPRRFASTGLGLPICRSIVQSHGGAIEIESEAGEGTRVVVSLAAKPAHLGNG